MLHTIPDCISLDVQLFITGAVQEPQTPSADEFGDLQLEVGKTRSDLHLLRMPFVHMQRGRPNLDLLMKEEVSRADGDISVNGECLISFAVSRP